MTENNPTQTNEIPARTHTEAPASVNIKFIQGGFDCMLTLRGETGGELLTKLDAVIKHLTERSATPTGNGNGNGHKPAAEAPASQPHTPAPAGKQPANGQKPTPEDGEVLTITVNTMAHCVTDNGAHYVRIKGGKFSKFGCKAWPEVLPQEAQDFQDWEIGAEFQPYDNMKHATVTGSKVTAFAA